MKQPPPKPARRLMLPLMFLGGILLGVLIIAYFPGFGNHGSDGSAEAAVSHLRLEQIPFDGARTYEYLKQLCAIGRRPSGSAGMEAQQKLLATHFQRLGGQVEYQTFSVRHPADPNTIVPMANMIVHWHPQAARRILLCAHYDTLPYPMEDKQNPQGTFIGANDNASGVAILMTLAQELPALTRNVGVDFVLFDGEEFIFRQQDRFFLGSEFFARQYRDHPPAYRYEWAVLLDMVGDADLQIYQERNSVWWRDSRPLVEEIWTTAARLGVKEFIRRKGYEIRDDHLQLHDIAKIPSCDIIDFDYPPWHTQGDTPDKCSPLSLAKVGWVLKEWLKGK